MKLFVIALCIYVLGCSKIIENAEGNPPSGQVPKHTHQVETKCDVVLSDSFETEIGAFPLSCGASNVMVGITRSGGLWKLMCATPKTVCETCVDGACAVPEEL